MRQNLISQHGMDISTDKTTVSPLATTPQINSRARDSDEKNLHTSSTGDDVDYIHSGRLSSLDFTPRRSLQAVVTNEFQSSVRGLENIHIYLWILKDFAWAQDDYWLAVVFGSTALVYCGVLLYQAIVNKDVEETYMIVALTMWLFGNYWWMAGEVGISGDDDTNSPETADILTSALCLLAFYHLILRPLGIITVSSKMLQRYKQTGLKSRFSYFITWRQYEHAHTLFWLGKDLSWNRLEPVPWILFSIPTILIAVDFIWVTWNKGQVVDSAHYMAQLIWVLANLTWAGGEIFNPRYDEPIPITTRSPTAYKTCRWWSSILLVLAFVPIGVLYLVVFPMKMCENEVRRRNLSLTQGSDDELLDGSLDGGGAVVSSSGSGASTPTSAAERISAAERSTSPVAGTSSGLLSSGGRSRGTSTTMQGVV